MTKSKIIWVLALGISLTGLGTFYATHAARHSSKAQETSHQSVSMPAAQEVYKQYDGRVALASQEFQKAIAPISKSIEELNKPIATAYKDQKIDLSHKCKALLKKQAEKQIELFKLMEEFYGKARLAMEEKNTALSK